MGPYNFDESAKNSSYKPPTFSSTSTKNVEHRDDMSTWADISIAQPTSDERQMGKFFRYTELCETTAKYIIRKHKTRTSSIEVHK